MIRRPRTFRHGVHPDARKELTEGQPIERIPVPDQLILPLSQHLGAPSEPVVSSGGKVYRGQMIAKANGFVSVPLHASVTGQVLSIGNRPHPSGKLVESVVIKSDPHSPQTLYGERPIEWERMSRDELLSVVQEGGFVGLGGAAFPTHVKLSVPEGKRVQYFFVNGSECEPYLTSDHRMMLEWADAIFLGVRVIQKILGAEKTFIGVENNKWDAIKTLKDKIPGDLPCELVPLVTKYPQGAEKMLISAVLRREVPSGKLPLDVQVVVQNVGTVAGLGDLFARGQPLIERVITVSGAGIRRPSTLLVPVGTRLADIVEHCGGLTEDARQILFGGPMMGTPQYNLDVPVVKGTSGIVCLTEKEVLSRKEYPCIKCASCLDACPVFLNPSQLGLFARMGHHDQMVAYHILDCIECGSCSYVCPSNIPLVQRFRVAKAIIREKQAREKEKQAKEKAGAR
jgi:electron transport complex protein RnfC